MHVRAYLYGTQQFSKESILDQIILYGNVCKNHVVHCLIAKHIACCNNCLRFDDVFSKLPLIIWQLCNKLIVPA